MDYKLHTPSGLNDILSDECVIKRKIENSMFDLFSSYGYKEIQTPTFEFYDVFSHCVIKLRLL